MSELSDGLGDIAASLHDISKTLEQIKALMLIMEERVRQTNVYVPGGLIMRQDGDHMQPQPPIPPTLNRHPRRDDPR